MNGFFVITEKLCIVLLYKKSAHKMLMKLTPGLLRNNTTENKKPQLRLSKQNVVSDLDNFSAKVKKTYKRSSLFAGVKFLIKSNPGIPKL